MEPTKIERWAVVNFSARCDARNLVRDLMKCAEMKGIVSKAILLLFSLIDKVGTYFNCDYVLYGL